MFSVIVLLNLCWCLSFVAPFLPFSFYMYKDDAHVYLLQIVESGIADQLRVTELILHDVSTLNMYDNSDFNILYLQTGLFRNMLQQVELSW